MSSDIIDQKALRRLLDVIGGDMEDLLELVQEFEESTPILVDKMKRAAADADLVSLRISAHSLKSNGRDLGALAMAALCEELEHACKGGDVLNPLQKVEEIGRSLDLAREALRKTPVLDE